MTFEPDLDILPLDLHAKYMDNGILWKATSKNCLSTALSGFLKTLGKPCLSFGFSRPFYWVSVWKSLSEKWFSDHVLGGFGKQVILQTILNFYLNVHSVKKINTSIKQDGLIKV